ncbi:MFS general substrate transporter [Cristinia sonorae]|uniref:MFS general substrate transporter n=1 Tax=Cristinia sonorae TaxID=1940300 RepID=A0A8K0XT02_9AGAR|nr:MFS general substrate transporter [Cristinia sonorae]
MSKLRRWIIVVVISTAAMCVTSCSSAAAFTEEGTKEDFGVSNEVAILGVSLFVQGLGLGPLLAGPLSELYGRNIVYRASFLFFWIFTWPVAFPPNMPVFLVFRWITGLFGAAFLSVAGGSISDLFADHEVATPMALFTVSPFIGPVAGPLIAGFITQNTNWRWVYRVFIIWEFVQITCLILFVRETYVPVILKWKAAALRKSKNDERYWAPLDRHRGLWDSVKLSCYIPFKLIFLDRMALLLDLWAALLLGILYLAFQVFPIIFGKGHHFNTQSVGMTFLGIGLGMILAVACNPFWNRLYRREALKHNGNPPPEMRLIIGMAGAIITPISLYWLAFTTYPSVHWVVPLLSTVFLGIGVVFCFTAVFTYLVVAYRPVAASAMAGNTFIRTTFAAAFPLFAGQMYERLGTVGATALLAGLTTVIAPLPFVFYRIGARLRAASKFAAA